MTPTAEARQGETIKRGALQDAIFNSAYFSSIATDEKGVIQIFNVGAERMLGYGAFDVVDQITPADISDPEELIARAAQLSAELDTPITPGFEALVFKASRGIEDIYELTYIRKDGSRFPATVSVTALRDAQDDIIGYLLIGTDNTARKSVERIEVMLGEAAGDELERRNGELVRFASTAAHDLRQPLQVIVGFAAILEHRFGDQLDDEGRHCVAAIRRNTHKMDHMVEDILEFAGHAQGPSPATLVDTARVVRDVVNDLRPALDGGAIIVRGFLPVLPGDAAQFARLFQNLIGNAVKFRGEDPPMVEVAAERAGDAWMFRVTDNGIGIGAGFADRLFEILQRERRGNQPGTGMGLAICRKIITYHGGRIWLDPNAAGPGATFRFTLPGDAP
jgi:signal transduction histidine kinase